MIAGVSLGFLGCSSSTGPDHGDPPSLPKLQNEKAKPDFSYFQQNNPKVSGTTMSGEYSNYYLAQTSALSVSTFFSLADMYTGFMSSASSQDAKYNDGVWEWKYSYNYQGQSIEIRLTSKNVTDGYKWAMYWSYDTGTGVSFDNYKVLEGTSSQDGSNGDWTFNSLTPETNETIAVLVSQWNVTSDTKRTMSLKVYDDTGSLSGTIVYEQDGSANTITFNSTDSGGSSITIFWDTDTQTGYFMEDGNKNCWDSNFANTPCS